MPWIVQSVRVSDEDTLLHRPHKGNLALRPATRIFRGQRAPVRFRREANLPDQSEPPFPARGKGGSIWFLLAFVDLLFFVV